MERMTSALSTSIGSGGSGGIGTRMSLHREGSPLLTAIGTACGWSRSQVLFSASSFCTQGHLNIFSLAIQHLTFSFVAGFVYSPRAFSSTNIIRSTTLVTFSVPVRNSRASSRSDGHTSVNPISTARVGKSPDERPNATSGILWQYVKVHSLYQRSGWNC